MAPPACDATIAARWVNAYAAAGNGVEVDLKGHLLIADPQAEQAAHRA
jgi:hypothetical protein